MDVKAWVDSAKDEEDQRFRKAIHLVLLAISKDNRLSHTLVIKGGIVMSLVYGGSRYTSDLDASSLETIDDLTPERLEKDLNRYLKVAEIEVGYGLAFNIHSIKPQPRDYQEARYPAYKVKIGFAHQHNSNEMQRLQKKQSPSIIYIDISFNELLTELDTEYIELNANQRILCYSLSQIIAEKYRSLLQQPVRNRNRRQDVYDIYHLLTDYSDHFAKVKTKHDVLEKLKRSAIGKNIDSYLYNEGILAPEIKKMALKDFNTLKLEIDVTKIDPNQMFDEISAYYQALPW